MIQKNDRLEILFLLILLSVFIVFFAVGLGYPPETRRLPMFVQAISIVLLVVQIFRVLLSHTVRVADPATHVQRRRSVLCFAVMAIVLVISYFFGLIPAMVILVFGNGLVFSVKNKYILLFISVSTGAAIYILFELFLTMNLYKGILFDK
jgi:hypothetical protein